MEAKFSHRVKDLMSHSRQEAFRLKNEFVSAAAVIAVSDEKWGEVPCAFIEVKDQSQWREDLAKQWCASHLASFKIPKYYFFESIPRTSTGKIQKYILREKAKNLLSK